jgi:hypothetical protein
VAAPQAAEAVAADGELTDQLPQPRMIHVRSDAGPQGGHRLPRGLLPVVPQVPLGGVEEDRPEQVDARGVVRGQGGGQAVHGEHVGEPVLHVGGVVRPAVDELQDADGHRLPPRRAAGAARGARPLRRPACAGRPRQADQVRGGVGVQPQHPGDGLQHLQRRIAVPALLQAQVVVGADAGEHRDLLAPQPRHPAQTAAAQPDVLRADQRPAGAQELAERVRGVHALTGRPCPPDVPVPVTPRNGGALPRPADRTQGGGSTSHGTLAKGTTTCPHPSAEPSPRPTA